MKAKHKEELFSMVSKRIKPRCSSLSKYNKRWQGKGGGIEGWLRVELVASLDSKFCKTISGSSGGIKNKGEKYPDLILEFQDEKAPIELKASSTSWTPFGNVCPRSYYGRALIFICPALRRTLAKREETLAKHDAEFKLEEICAIHKGKAFYLGLIDLSNKTLSY